MMSREANLPRKAMRVTSPLAVEIAGRSYAAKDWSTAGVAVLGLQEPPPAAEPLAARLAIPLPEATLMVPVQLASTGVRGDAHAFEFRDLSPRARALLRHYMELALEGRLDEPEGVLALASQPGPGVPSHAPLSLQQAAGAHRGRAFGSVLIGLGVLAAAAGLAWYNLTYQLEGTGFVSGSVARITANHQGQLGRMLVQPGTRVEPDTPLFAVENPQLRDEIGAMEQQVAQLASEQARLAAARRSAESGLLQSLRRDWQARQQDLATAQRLLDAGAITQRDVLLVSEQVRGMQQDYLKQVADAATRTQSLDSSDALARVRLELAAKKVLLARQETERVVRAPVRGKVFHVERQAGEFVSPQDPVVLLEADVTPSVLLRLPNDDALKLRLGMPATIYVPFQDRTHAATVTAVGLSAASAAAGVAQELGADETLVKLDFEDRQMRLPANARVTVWIRNPALPWS